MAGALDSLFKDVAKQIVADLGDSLDTEIDYTRKFDGAYDTATGAFTTFDRPYFGLKCPIEFVRSEEEEGREEREARIYISPDQIGGNQPTMQDEITLKFAGASRAAQITDVNTYRGGQEYLYILRVRF
ncbi:phage tail protein [uncultured Mediterranean phage uvMED]|nr:phage tail protein [uncultured Mediterranean phage uvMED]BAR23361.1 phage tail protein [uncultured Mediterranean phage uvMED]BAR23573.1 phage tail protein [uncultured Mediterranean phage uvMED]BAR23647.1 phage tail protein [uncultured Mediterranean phage uvMED]BAR23666.1 phage tail protein [uncultured Mediterranean phage uvMED]